MRQWKSYTHVDHMAKLAPINEWLIVAKDFNLDMFSSTIRLHD